MREKIIEVFCCYAREDQNLLLELTKHLAPLQREGRISLWADTDIKAGKEWRREVHLHLNTAKIILLLVSSDFLASDYCYSVEMQRALERHDCGEARVIPIILRPVNWQNAPLSKLQVLPKNATPVTSPDWGIRDNAFLNITEEIKKIVLELISSFPAPQPPDKAPASKYIWINKSQGPVIGDRTYVERHFQGVTSKRLLLVVVVIFVISVALIVPVATQLLYLSTSFPFIQTAKQVALQNTAGQPTTNHHPITPSPMPATQTNCPPAGQSRAAVLAPYWPQGHNALVYAASTQGPAGYESSTLLRYDTMTRTASSIITVPDYISEVQLSADGQWVIFSTDGYDPLGVPTSKPARIQMVRIDGQGLQTLYCSSSSDSLSFSASPGLDPAESGWNLFFSLSGNPMIGVIDMIKGAIRFEFRSQYSYQPMTWQNDTDLYLLRLDSSNSGNPSSLSSLVVLSFARGIPVPASDSILPVIIQVPSLCSDVDFSPDLRTFFTSQCKGSADFSCSGCLPTEGASTIDAINLDTTSRKSVSIFTSSTLAITWLRAITSSTLLFMVENTDQYDAQNGLWKMNTDGTGLQRLFFSRTMESMFFGAHQYPWNTVSRDGSMYALKTSSAQAKGYDKLFIGSLNGGQPMSIAQDGVSSVDRYATLNIAGWTTW